MTAHLKLSNYWQFCSGRILKRFTFFSFRLDASVKSANTNLMKELDFLYIKFEIVEGPEEVLEDLYK